MSSRTAKYRRHVVTIASVVALSTATTLAIAPGGAVVGRPERPAQQATVHGRVSRSTLFLEGDAEGRRITAAQMEYANRSLPRRTVRFEQTRRATAAARRLESGAALSGDARAVLGALPSWQELGPIDPLVPAPATYTGRATNVAGRTPALAIAPTCVPGDCRVWAGAAGGGVWRTDDALAATPDWRATDRGLGTNAIGSLLVDPSDPSGDTIYVGTGEPNGSSDSEAGLGLYRSTNGGDTWQLVRGSRAVALDRSIASITVDPRDGDHLYIGVAVARHGMSNTWGGRATPPGAPPVGLYESTDGGASWEHVLALPGSEPVPPGGISWFQGGVNRVELDPNDPDTVYAAVFGYGLWRRAGEAGSFRQVFATYNPDDSTGDRTEFDLVDLGADTRIYLGDSSDDLGYSALFRVDDAAVPASRLTDGSSNPGWIALSDPNLGTPGFGSWGFCHAQCGYDQFVASPPGRPDEVWLGGAMNYDEIFGSVPPRSNGRAVVRSTDAGESWDDMTNDARTPPLGMHPDQHEIVWSPDDPRIAFVSSDGGIVRVPGRYTDDSAECVERGLAGGDLANCEDWLERVPTKLEPINLGLATLQFQHLSVNPADAADVMGGTQDNGTWSNTGPAGWFETINGDGGHSGYDAGNPEIRFHTYYDAYVDVNFRGNDPLGWNWIGDPMYYSTEQRSFYVSMIADPVRRGYMYVGMEHVWRTTDNGGDRAYLEEHCNEYTGDFQNVRGCGDWKPVGGGAGNLTSTKWGADKAGQFISVVERAGDRDTLWAGTRVGRVFITKNIASTGDVKFVRLDSPAQPERFVSDIVVDPRNPNRAWVSFSGYSAYTPGQKGHVFSVRYDPATRSASWSRIDRDLGDIPVLALAYDGASRTLFASHDFGIMQRTGAGWVPAGQGLPRVATYGLTIAPDGSVLYAATHGRGIWRLPI